MTPADMARIHAVAFAPHRGWSCAEFEGLCASVHVTCYETDRAFALVRTVANETELLTLATDPTVHRQGRAILILRRWLQDSKAERAFLEVAADNHAAQLLYAKLGFMEIGRRPGYYSRNSGARCDAVLMEKALSRNDKVESRRKATKTS